jgi:hypothetical protein
LSFLICGFAAGALVPPLDGAVVAGAFVGSDIVVGAGAAGALLAGSGEEVVPVLTGIGEGCVVCANAALGAASAIAAAASISRLSWCIDEAPVVCEDN